MFSFGDSNLSFFGILLGVFLIFCVHFFSKSVERLAFKWLSKRKVEPGLKDTLSKISRYVVIVLGALIVFDIIGISFKSLAALSAVLMVGIGFGLQNIAQNFISGLIILFERPIKTDDIVTVKGVTGRVISIGARATEIVTREDSTIIVPNSQFISEQVINDSFTGDKLRIKINVGVEYGSDAEQVSFILISAANKHRKVLKDPAPTVMFQDFGESSLDFCLFVWIEDIWTVELIKSDLRFDINKEFNKAGIVIPYPQRDLHIKSDVRPKHT